MRLKHCTIVLTFVAAMSAYSFGAGNNDQAKDNTVVQKIDLKVEYVTGRTGTPRSKSFVEFLEKNFEQVETTSRYSLKSPEDSFTAFENADVLVVDTNLAGLLPAGYSKPMVVISGSGVQTAESLGAKLDWL